MVLGTLIALLLKELRPLMRSVRHRRRSCSRGRCRSWSRSQLWLWMTNYENGVVNYVLTKLGVGDFMQYDWFANPYLGLRRDHVADRLGRGAVRRDHDLRRADAGAARAARGRGRSTARARSSASAT